MRLLVPTVTIFFSNKSLDVSSNETENRLKIVHSETESWGLERAGSDEVFLHREQIQLTKAMRPLMESTSFHVLVCSGCCNKIPQTRGLLSWRH